MLSYAALFLVGYSIATIVWYLNHRFIFHGRLGKLPVLKKFTRLHTLHHQNPYNHRRNKFIFIPWWGHVLLFAVSLPLLFASPACWLGALAFAGVYGWRHYRIHNADASSKHHIHHAVHHLIEPNANFSGVHPIVDRLFGTDYPRVHPTVTGRKQ